MRKTLRESPFYPWLFSLFPALSLYSRNLEEASVRSLLVASGLSLVLTALVWLATRVLVRDGRKAALLTFLFCLMFFTYGHLGSSLDLPPGMLILWGAVFLGLATLVILTRRDLSRGISGLNLFATVLVLSAAAQIVWPRPQVSGYDLGMTDLQEDVRLADMRPDRNLLPDIYYLILDRYANEKALATQFGFDNGEFLGFLRAQGFYIASDSRCNYTQTLRSLASSLNMDYVDRARSEKDIGQRYLYHILKDFRAWRILKSLGYTYFHLGTWWEGTSYNALADRNLSGTGMDIFWGDFFEKFVGTTALQPFVHGLVVKPSKRARILRQFAQLERIPAVPGPRFVFTHILVTHRPYAFGPNGVDFHGAEGSEEFTYVDQVCYTNTRLTQMISALLKTASRPTVIILQSDEGVRPKLRLAKRKKRYHAWIKSVHEPILNAMAFPGVDTSVLCPSISPVNTFRALFNLYFGAHYQLLPDETRYVSGKDASDESD